MGSPQRAAKADSSATNVVRLRDWRPALLSERPRARRLPLLAAAVISIAAHLAALQLMRAPAPAELPQIRRIDVVLVQPPVPLPVAPPAAVAPPPQKELRERAKPKPVPPQREAAPRVPSPVLAVPREEAAPSLAQPAPAIVEPAAPPTPAPRSEAAVAAGAPAQPARAGPASPPSFNAAYLRNPPPRYPLIARRNGEQGTVTLRVLVLRDGSAGSVTLEKTSGSVALDTAAINTVKEWRFVPAQQNGQPVEAPVLVPIVFRLQDAS